MSNKALKVANLLKISDRDAQAFCKEVQKHFRGNVPSYAQIGDCLEDHIGSTPQEIAEIMSSKGMVNRTTYIEQPSQREMRTKKKCKYQVFREARVEKDSLGVCPHGVPTIQPCALCDRKRFLEMTGID